MAARCPRAALHLSNGFQSEKEVWPASQRRRHSADCMTTGLDPAAGGAGSLQVVGYTDDTGTTAHNVDLSKRRAAVVAAAIKALLPAGVQLPTSGRGEAEPVAPNTTVEGPALNRRVSIVFAPQGGAK